MNNWPQNQGNTQPGFNQNNDSAADANAGYQHMMRGAMGGNMDFSGLQGNMPAAFPNMMGGMGFPAGQMNGNPMGAMGQMNDMQRMNQQDNNQNTQAQDNNRNQNMMDMNQMSNMGYGFGQGGVNPMMGFQGMTPDQMQMMQLRNMQNQNMPNNQMNPNQMNPGGN